MAIEYAPNGFEPEKAVAAVAYLAERANTTLYPVMKMMYLADRLHLQKYGRFIAGDAYVAMAEGPVPKGAYNLAKVARGDDIPVPGRELAQRSLAYGPGHMLGVRAEVDYEELSRSDIECLDTVLRQLEYFGSAAIVKDSHDKAWEQVRNANCGKLAPDMTELTIACTLEGSDAIIDHLRDPNPGAAE